MSDSLTKEFRDQLTTTMDSVLKKAVFEIMKIFQDSLHDHQMELAQKEEEIAQLQIKLLKTDIELMDSECGGDGGVEMSKTQMTESAREPEDILNVSTGVAEIECEVPDDWCAPLGCEVVTKQDEGVCPSVRLRSLYIPLLQIPVKQEVVNRHIESHQQTEGISRSRRGSSFKERDKHTKDGSSPMCDQRTRRPPVRNNMKKLVRNIEHEYLTGRAASLIAAEEENTPKTKIEKRKITAKSTEQERKEKNCEKRYSCKFCKKVFDTQFGRSVHVRSHKKCRGCKKEFPFPSVLRRHKPYCGKLQKLLSKEAESTDPPKSQSCVEEKTATLRKKQVIIKKESAPSSSTHNESSCQKDETTKKHCCVHCNKKFNSRRRMKEHMGVHSGEKPFPCSMCPKKFRINRLLKSHIMRMHQDQMNSSETNGGLAWTMPSEVIESSKDTSQAVHQDKVQREPNPDGKAGPRWQTMGTRCSKGFLCILCQKLMRSKYMLVKHFRTHTAERLVKCEHCPAKLRSREQHERKCPNSMIQCQVCEKKFASQAKCDRHMSNYHRDWTHFCKVCGKGFFTKGRLRNHMERHK